MRQNRTCFVTLGGVVLAVALGTQRLDAYELNDLSKSSAEANSLLTITTDGLKTFNASSVISVTFFQGVSVVCSVSSLDVVPNTSIDVRVPDIPVGEYEVGVEIEGDVSTNKLSPFHIVLPRPFQFIVVEHEIDGGVAGGALPADSVPVCTDYKAVAFGDVDNDGDLDIYFFNSKPKSGCNDLVCDCSKGFVDRLFINQGGAQGGTVGQYLIGALPAIAGNEFGRTYDGDLVDLNGDGLRDVIRSDADGIHLLINTGGGTFVNRPDLLPTDAAITMGIGVSDFDGIGGFKFDGVDAADVDGDGAKDLIFSNYEGHVHEGEEADGHEFENLILLNRINQAEGRFVIANRDGDVFASHIDDQAHGAAFGDADGDGDPDLLIVNIVSDQPNRLLLNQGSVDSDWLGFVDGTDNLPEGTANTGDSVVGGFADLDNDGDMDIFVISQVGGPGSNRNNIYWNDGTGRFKNLGSTGLSESVNGTYDFAFGDVDFDGDIDIIESPRFGSGSGRVLLNMGGRDANMLFVAKPSPFFPTSQHALGIDLGDVDLDLDLDLIGGGFNGDGITLYENDLFNPASEDFDYVIVIDRTLSMVSGGKDFLTPVKNVAKAIIAQKRPDDLVGIVTFEYTGSTPEPMAGDPMFDVFKAETLIELDESVDMTPAQLQDIVDDIVAGTCEHAGPGFGCTSLGQGVRQGLGVLKPNTNPDRIKVIVLLTDGAQNLPPSTTDLIASLPSGFPSNVRVYAIALGTETDNQMLTDIASLGSGFHQSLDAFNLADVFQNIEADATEKQIIPSEDQESMTHPLFSDTDFQNPSLITFDDLRLPAGTPIRDQLLDRGVRFINDSLFAIPRLELVETITPPFGLLNTTEFGANERSKGVPLTILFTELQEKVGMFIGNGAPTDELVCCEFGEFGPGFPTCVPPTECRGFTELGPCPAGSVEGKACEEELVCCELGEFGPGFPICLPRTDCQGFTDLGPCPAGSVEGEACEPPPPNGGLKQVTQAVLSAFDQYGNLIGQSTAPVPVISDGFIGIRSSAGNIAKVQLDYGEENVSEQIDNLMFEQAETAGMATSRTFFVDGQDKQIRVTLSWQNPGALRGFALVDPLGRTISAAGEPTIEFNAGDVFEVYSIKAPLVGTWTALIDADSGERTFLSVISSSGLKMSLKADRRKYTVAEPMGLTAFIAETVGGESQGVPGVAVDVTVEKPNGALVRLPDADILDEGDGSYSITFRGADQEGTYNFRVVGTLDPGTDRARSRVRITSTVASLFDPTGFCDERSTLQVDPQVLVADGDSLAKIFFALRDCQGEPATQLENAVVSFTVDAGRLVGQPLQIGGAEFTQDLVVPTKVGDITIHVIVDTAKLDLQAVLRLVPGPVEPDGSRVDAVASPGFVKADGQSQARIVVVPRDAHGNRLGPGQEVQIEFKGPVLGDWLGPVQDLPDGSYQRILQAREETGETSFQAIVNGTVLAQTPVLPFSFDGEDLRDTDNDGISNADDNCPFVFNPDQDDTNGDGIGDLCDPCPNMIASNQDDVDLDGLFDECDNCPDVFNPDQADADRDGLGDACDGCGVGICGTGTVGIFPFVFLGLAGMKFQLRRKRTQDHLRS